MEILQPGLLPEHITGAKTRNLYLQFQRLLDKAATKKIPFSTVEAINENVKAIASAPAGRVLYEVLKEKQKVILSLPEKRHKIVPKNHYRKMWMAAGLAVFGLLLGMAFGLSMGNIGLFGTGFPVGLAIGVAVGTSLDRKAETEGRQMDIELKY